MGSIASMTVGQTNPHDHVVADEPGKDMVLPHSGLIILIDATSLDHSFRANIATYRATLCYDTLLFLIATVAHSLQPRPIAFIQAVADRAPTCSTPISLFHPRIPNTIPDRQHVLIRLLTIQVERIRAIGATRNHTIVLISPHSQLDDAVAYAREVGLSVEIWETDKLFVRSGSFGSSFSHGCKIGKIGRLSKFNLSSYWKSLAKDALTTHAPNSPKVQSLQKLRKELQESLQMDNDAGTGDAASPNIKPRKEPQRRYCAQNLNQLPLRPSELIPSRPPSTPGNGVKLRCPKREFCRIAHCKNKHTDAELEFMKEKASKINIGKQKMCRRVKKCYRLSKKNSVCSFLHDDEKLFCTACLGRHDNPPCQTERKKPVDEKTIYLLVKKGCLVRYGKK